MYIIAKLAGCTHCASRAGLTCVTGIIYICIHVSVNYLLERRLRCYAFAAMLVLPKMFRRSLRQFARCRSARRSPWGRGPQSNDRGFGTRDSIVFMSAAAAIVSPTAVVPTGVASWPRRDRVQPSARAVVRPVPGRRAVLPE